MTRPILDCPTPLEFTGEELATILTALCTHRENLATRGDAYREGTAFFQFHNFFRPVKDRNMNRLIKRLYAELKEMQEEQT